MVDETLHVDDELELRPVTRELHPQLTEAVLESLDHLQPWMAWAHDDWTLNDAEPFLDNVEKGAVRAWGIHHRATGRFLGLVVLNRWDEDNRTANLGYWLRADATGAGVITRSVGRLLDHALDKLDLERVELFMSTENAASIAVAERLGLHEEGLRRRAIRIGDRQDDARVFAALRSPG